MEQYSKTGWIEMRYLIVIEKTATGYSAYAPDLLGCVAAGNSEAEVEQFMREAIDFHLEGLMLEGFPVPPPNSYAAYSMAFAGG